MVDDNNLFYKFGKLEEAIERIDEKLDKLIEKMDDQHKGLDTRVSALEKWQTTVMAKVSLACGSFMVFWAVLGDNIQRMFN